MVNVMTFLIRVVLLAGWLLVSIGASADVVYEKGFSGNCWLDGSISAYVCDEANPDIGVTIAPTDNVRQQAENDVPNCYAAGADICRISEWTDDDNKQAHALVTGYVSQSGAECLELGQFYNPDNGQCVTECPSGGALDHYCLTNPEPQCSESSDDYLGSIGWGDNHQSVCSGDSSCGDNERYAFQENDEGAWQGYCVNNESNPPVCPGGWDSVLLITGNGFACGETNEDTADPNKHDSSNGDSDGDGQADNNGFSGQLQDIKGLLGEGNNHLGNIGRDLKEGFGNVVDAIGNIPGGGGGGNGSGQTEIVGEDGNAITWSGEAITMEVADGLDELAAVQGEYENLIANIRSQMSASFGSFTGQGGLEDYTFTVWGVEVNAGLSKWANALSIVGSVIVFAASFVALGILMGGKD